MLSTRRTGLVSLVILLTSLTACASSSTGENIERILAADPRLENNPNVFGTPSNGNNQTTAAVSLPADFPAVIPIYPNAQLQEVTQPTSELQLTRWLTLDSTNSVQTFYGNYFQANNWEVLRQPTNEQGGTFEARLNDLLLTVSLAPSSAVSNNTSATPAPNQATELVIQYTRNTVDSTQAAAPQSGDPDFIGPVLPQQPTQTTPTPEQTTASVNTQEQVFTDINQAPAELRQYIADLAALGVLSGEQTNGNNKQVVPANQLEPNKIISRRQYARWLVAANNQIHANSPSQQIRGASEITQPAFQDVSRSDPDFAIIQGLAEAGLIPSTLSGDSTAVLFRPDAPLTREQLILWKVPLDIRQGLPTASVDAVKQTWGFQDAGRIEPKALRAVLADFQNSEQSNIRRVFGYTTLFQPKKPVTRAEAAAALWYFGAAGEGLSAQDALQIEGQPKQNQG